MAVITPRRRFLITAPLALLLPAGLLTYLGLQMVNGVESQHEEQVNDIVTKIVRNVRNRSLEKVNADILYPFRSAVQEEIRRLLPVYPPPPGSSFVLKKKLEFASAIFVYGSDGRVYFFHPVEDNPPNSFQWVLYHDPRAAFTAWVKNIIDLEIQTAINLYGENPRAEENSRGYLFRPYPNESYAADTPRELITFVAQNIPSPTNEWLSKSAPDSHRLIALGFTMNFGYIDKTFFQELLEKMWSEGDLIYPIAIEDRVTSQRIQIADLGISGVEDSRKHFPRPFIEHVFPWHWIRFSARTGEDILSIAAYGKIVYYCLIAAANVIMIVGVFGMIRNVAKELALSDMRSDFVARVSHDLRTPLGLIRLYAETLEMGRTKDETKQKEYLNAITKESERLSHLINNILNFSQIEANKKQYRFAETPVDTLIYDSVETMRYHLERHGLDIRVEVEPNLPNVLCDREAMLQALYNLLSNAMKYSGEGKEITARAYRQGDEVVFSVTDHGIGIAPDQQKKIFQEFYRVDDPLVRQKGGSGLGLAVVKHIAEGHGARLQVVSAPGKGSTFSIQLPLREIKETAAVRV